MTYDPINYTDEELKIFQEIQRKQKDLDEYEKLSEENKYEGSSNIYRSKKFSLQIDIVTLIRQLDIFGVSSVGLATYQDLEQHEAFSKWYNKVSEQEQIKVYNQLEELNNLIKEESSSKDSVNGKAALMATQKQKFFALVKSLDLYGVDTDKIETAQEAVDEYNTEWDFQMGKENLSSWHFEMIGIKGYWELAKLHEHQNKPSLQKK